MGIPLVAGRDITWQEELEKRPVALVSENLARQYWGSPAAAIGKLIHIGSTDPWHEVIGVAGDVHDHGVNQDPPTSVYWGLFQENFATQKERMPRYVHYVIRTPRAGSASFFKDCERAVWSVNHDLPLAYNKTIGELYTKSMARTSFTLVLLSIAGAMTLLLGSSLERDGKVVADVRAYRNALRDELAPLQPLSADEFISAVQHAPVKDRLASAREELLRALSSQARALR